MEGSFPSEELDELDIAILRELQVEGRISNAELARRISLSQPAVHNRVKRLEERGYIRQYVALLDKEKMGYDMVCFINIRMQLHQQDRIDDFKSRIRQLPQILECHHLTGEYDYLLKVVIRNRKDLERFVVENLTPMPGVEQIQTSVVFSEVKATTALPLD